MVRVRESAHESERGAQSDAVLRGPRGFSPLVALYSTPVTSHLRWTAMSELRDDASTAARRTTRPGPIESAADGASDGTR